MSTTHFSGLQSLADHLRQELERKKFVLLYAYNSTGKTRLSTVFKDIGKAAVINPLVTENGNELVTENGDQLVAEEIQGDTLYFNAFTEDLFYWDNDLANDRQRVLKINRDSRFFAGLEQYEMDNRIRNHLKRYADFDFKIDTAEWEVTFSRKIVTGNGDQTQIQTETVDDIKISRGEENIFIWCFFLAIMQFVLDEDDAYKWVKYVYIDDPISSLDENNAIAVANHLAQMLINSDTGTKTVISSHHVLFFNVLYNEFKGKAYRHFLQKGETPDSYTLLDTDSTPFLQHLDSLVKLNAAQLSGDLNTHHFNMMRRVMEQTASFFGMANWKQCIKVEEDDLDQTFYKRIIDLMSHGDYSLYEPIQMMDENKRHFRKIFRQFITNHPFNTALFASERQ